MSTDDVLHRATFESPYVIPKARRPINATRPRLGDHLLCVVEFLAPEYVQETAVGEFSVIDLATRQKAWFETPPDVSLDQITAMIESHFDAVAYRADASLWIVQC